MHEDNRTLTDDQYAEVALDLMVIKVERECMSREAKRAVEDLRAMRTNSPILHWVYSLLH